MQFTWKLLQKQREKQFHNYQSVINWTTVKYAKFLRFFYSIVTIVKYVYIKERLPDDFCLW